LKDSVYEKVWNSRASGNPEVETLGLKQYFEGPLF